MIQVCILHKIWNILFPAKKLNFVSFMHNRAYKSILNNSELKILRCYKSDWIW